MTTRVPIHVSTLLAVLLAAPSAWAVAEDIAMPWAYLAYPPNGDVGVPGNTLIFAPEVTAMQLESPEGETIAALLDPSIPSLAGSVFEPAQVLSPGSYRVLGVPSDVTSNYSGPGIAIELGTITIGSELDEQPIVVQTLAATWALGTNDLSLSGGRDGGRVSEPTRTEVDLGDADTLMDGTPEGTSPWSQGTVATVSLGESVPQIDPQTASVRLRVIDASGNVGEWSQPIGVQLARTADRAPRACAAGPGAVPAGRGLPALAVAVVVLLVTRRTTR